MLNVLRCQLTNAEARFNNSLRPRKPEGSLGRTAQDGHLDSHTAPELCNTPSLDIVFYAWRKGGVGVGVGRGNHDKENGNYRETSHSQQIRIPPD